eukprot:GHVS01074416.1.p1 GENE.GHVS01074416.1~~GHVS01074416.1.p1  ORF type:complete len:347 (+),score=65.18 GHVS01074416.1:325-1365(+)
MLSVSKTVLFVTASALLYISVVAAKGGDVISGGGLTLPDGAARGLPNVGNVKKTTGQRLRRRSKVDLDVIGNLTTGELKDNLAFEMEALRNKVDLKHSGLKMKLQDKVDGFRGDGLLSDLSTRKIIVGGKFGKLGKAGKLFRGNLLRNRRFPSVDWKLAKINGLLDGKFKRLGGGRLVNRKRSGRLADLVDWKLGKAQDVLGKVRNFGNGRKRPFVRNGGVSKILDGKIKSSVSKPTGAENSRRLLGETNNSQLNLASALSEGIELGSKVLGNRKRFGSGGLRGELKRGKFTGGKLLSGGKFSGGKFSGGKLSGGKLSGGKLGGRLGSSTLISSRGAAAPMARFRP